jgi:hypothetical protein
VIAGMGFSMTQPHDFCDRYQAGQHIAVWRELTAFGEAIRHEPLLSEATTVCKEIVRRARINLRTLHRRLLDLGYEFAEPEAALKDAADDAPSKLDEFENEFGIIPIIARLWYLTFDSVNFCQADHQRAYLKNGFPPLGPDIYGLGSHPVLYFQSLERSRGQFKALKAEHDDYAKEARELGHKSYPTEFGSHLFLGGWASNCDPKGFALPCTGIDGVIFNDGGSDTYFVDELRKAFQWGGFPFWQWGLKKPKFYSPMEYRPNFKKLLPILKEGLLDL